MKWLKPSLVVLALLVCLAGSGYLIWMAGNRTALSSREAFLTNLLLFILSSTFAGILGLVYAKMTASEKADTIATSSTEKMVNLSVQLRNLASFLRQTRSVADQELTINVHAALNAYRHRIESAEPMAKSLAAFNEAFKNDWLGIVSSRARREIEEKFQDYRGYADVAETYEKLLEEQSDAPSGTDDQGKVADRLEELEQKMLQAAKKLPVQAIPFRPMSNVRAVAVSQQTTTAAPDLHAGMLRITVLRPVPVATGSGRLIPNMPSKPWVRARLVSCPGGLNTSWYRCTAGAGTTFDFSIHLRSVAPNTPLPPGEYVCEYRATIAPSVGEVSQIQSSVVAACPQCGNSFPVHVGRGEEYAERPCHGCGASLRISADGRTTAVPTIAATSEQAGTATPEEPDEASSTDSCGQANAQVQHTSAQTRDPWSSHQMTIECPNPNCGRGVPVNFRPGRALEMRVCLWCNAHLAISQDGQVAVRGYYQAVDTGAALVGGRPLLACPKCGMNWAAITERDGTAYAVCNTDKLVLRAKSPQVAQTQPTTVARIDSAVPTPDSTSTSTK